MVSRRFDIQDEYMDFMKEYKEAFGMNIQKFVNEAIKEKIERIEAKENIETLNKLK